MKEIANADTLEAAPLLLSGYRSLASAPLLQQEALALANMRRLCRHFATPATVRRAVIKYNDYYAGTADDQQQPRPDARLFRINESSLAFSPLFTAPPAEYQPALAMLRSLPPLKSHDRGYPDPERRLFIRDDSRDGERHYLEGLPTRLVAAQQHQLDSSQPPADITVSYAALLQQAREMDRIDRQHTDQRPENWEKRLINLVFQHHDGQHGLGEADTLDLNGLTHLIGLPGSGKTTVMMCLARWLFQQGRSMALFFPSVEVCRRYLVKLQFYGVSAGLLVGQSARSRQRHSNNLAQTVACGDPLHGFARSLEGADYFAINCLLPAYTKARERLADHDRHYCDEVYEEPDGTRKPIRRLCPLWAQCGRNRAASELPRAQVWLGHIAATDSRVAVQTTAFNLRLFELIARRCDLVVIDEADQVQTWLDKRGLSYMKLSGYHESFHYALQSQVHRLIAAGDNHRLSKPDYYALSMELTLFQRCSDQLMHTIQKLQPGLQKRYAGLFLTSSRLISDLLGTADNEDSTRDPLFRRRDALSELWENAALAVFYRGAEGQDARRPLRSGTAKDLGLDSLAALEALGQGLQDCLRDWQENISYRAQQRVTEQLQAQLKPLLKQVDDEKISAQHERIALLAAVTFTIIAYRRLRLRIQPLVEQQLLRQEVMEQKGSDELLQVCTENLLGKLSGVRYDIDAANGHDHRQNVRLQHVVFDGSPRALLYHLHELLPEVNGRRGPAVLLASATSFLEHSPSYHIHRSPDYLVRSRQQHHDYQRSRYRFQPLQDSEDPERSLQFSGQSSEKRREHALQQMVDALLGPDPEQCIVRSDIDGFDVDRGIKRKAALVVNSYQQCADLMRHIDKRHPLWSDRTRAVVRDQDADSAHPGRLTVAQVEAVGDDPDCELLIFPMMALGRGANIVFSDGPRTLDAAIGTLYFLTRPHPTQDDLGLLVGLAGRASEAFNTADLSHASDLDALTREHRDQRGALYKHIGRLLREPLHASRLRDLFEPFTADIAVMLLQTIGRAMRNGCPAQCVFIDAAWARESARGRRDDDGTSMLVQLRSILQQLVAHPDPRDAAYYRELYLAFLDPLQRIDGLLSADHSGDHDPRADETHNPAPLMREPNE